MLKHFSKLIHGSHQFLGTIMSYWDWERFTVITEELQYASVRPAVPPVLFPSYLVGQLLGEVTTSNKDYREKHQDSKSKGKVVHTGTKEHRKYGFVHCGIKKVCNQDERFPTLGHTKMKGVREWANLHGKKKKKESRETLLSPDGPQENNCVVCHRKCRPAKVRLQERPQAWGIQIPTSTEHLVTRNWQIPKKNICVGSVQQIKMFVSSQLRQFS